MRWSSSRYQPRIRSLDSRTVTDLEFAHSILIARPPEEVYRLISDVTRMGEWSPQCRACWWDEGGGPEVGAWFTGRNETPQRTWETRSQVVAADPGREFAWEVNNGWVRWGFTLEAGEAVAAGRSEAAGEPNQSTLLTQNWNFKPKGIAGFHERFGDRAEAEIVTRTQMARTGIPVTLAAIKATAEA